MPDAYTYDHEVQGLYEGEWECVYTGEDAPDAFARLAEYRANEAGTPFRYKRVRQYHVVGAI